MGRRRRRLGHLLPFCDAGCAGRANGFPRDARLADLVARIGAAAAQLGRGAPAVYSLRAFCINNGDDDAMAAAVNWIANNGHCPAVVNISCRPSGTDPTALNSPIQNAISSGLILTLSGGCLDQSVDAPGTPPLLRPPLLRVAPVTTTVPLEITMALTWGCSLPPMGTLATFSVTSSTGTRATYRSETPAGILK